MTDEAMSAVLQSSHLNIDEMEIIEAVREWATVNSVRFKFDLDTLTSDILSCLRMLPQATTYTSQQWKR